MIQPDTDASLPLGMVFDKALRSDIPHEIHELASIYSKNPHFQNDREVWKTILGRLQDCSDDVERLRWLKFCLKALEKKDLEKIRKHKEDLDVLLVEIEKVDHLKRVLTEFKNLPQQKLNEKIAGEWVVYVMLAEPGIAAATFPGFAEGDVVINSIIELWENQPKMRNKLVSILIEAQKFGLWNIPKVRKNVRLLALKAVEEKLERGEELLALMREAPLNKKDPELDEEGKSFHDIARSGFTPVDVDHLVRDISLKTTLLIEKFNIREFFHQAWTKGKGPSVVNFINFFNALSDTVSESILSVKSSEEKAKLIEFWIEVAMHAFTLNDLNQPIAILAALDKLEITHLRKAWEHVNSSLVMKKTALFELYLPFNNYKKFRNHIAKLEDNNSNYIPFLALYLKDLIFADEGNPSIVNDRINIDKVKMLVKTLGKIFRKGVQNEKDFIYHTRIIKTIEAYGTSSNRRKSTPI